MACLGVCLARGGVISLVDQMPTEFPDGARAFVELIAVANQFEPGDRVGVMAINQHVRFDFASTATAGELALLLDDNLLLLDADALLAKLAGLLGGPDINANSTTGRVHLPIMAAGPGALSSAVVG